MASFIGVPIISDELEFGLPRIPFYFVLHEALLIAVLLAFEAIVLLILLDQTLLFLTAAGVTGIGLSMLFMRMRDRYGQAWLFDVRMRMTSIGGIQDRLGVFGPLSGRRRAMSPAIIPAFVPFRGNMRDLGAVDADHAFAAPMDHRPILIDRRGPGRFQAAGIGDRLALGRRILQEGGHG